LGEKLTQVPGEPTNSELSALMRISRLVTTLVVLMITHLPAGAYDQLATDYKSCMQGAGKVSNKQIVRACTRLIDNSAKKNELVGYFHALRATANTDRKQNCQDARIAAKLLKNPKVQKQIKQLATTNCQSASAPARAKCLSANVDRELIEGLVRIENFKDAAGRPNSAYILALSSPTCLSSSDPDERVDRSRTIHIFASEDRVHASIKRFVGQSVQVRGRPSPAHTVHHRAPIIMDVSKIEDH